MYLFFHKFLNINFGKRGIKLELKAFAVTLSNTLIARGIDKETAVSSVLKIMRSLSEEDHREIAKYNDSSDFVALSDTLAQFIEDEKRIAEAIEAEQISPTVDDMSAQTRYVPHISKDNMADTIQMNTGSFFTDTKMMDIPHTEEQETELEADKTRTDIPTSPANASSNMQAVREEKTKPEKKKKHYTEYTETKLTPRGKKIFITGAILTSPLTLAALVLFYLVFALCVVGVAALIVSCFIMLAGLVIVGSLACLIGIIYGITQLFGSIGIGIYEIGVGIVASGVTIVVSVLVYYLGTRALPYLMRQLVAFFKQVMGRIPAYIDRAKEECNKL